MISEEVQNFLRDASWATIGVVLALGLDFVFYIAMGRALTTAEFGLFGLLTSIYYILLKAPYSALEITSRKIEADGGSAFLQLGFKALKLGISMSLIVLAASPALINLFDLSYVNLAVYSLIFPLGYVLAVLTGTSQGRNRFDVYAGYEVVSSLFKFSAILTFLLGLGLTGAIMAYVMEIWSGVAVLYRYLNISAESVKFEYSNTLVRSLGYVLALNAVFSLDIIFMGIFKDASVVGAYNSVSVLGKAVFFTAVAINKSVFPKFGGKDERLLLKASFAIIALEGLMFFTFFSLFGRLFFKITFGQGYVSAVSFAPFYMAFISVVGMVALVGNYYLSKGDRRLWLIAVMPFIQILLILLFHKAVIQFIAAGFVSAVVCLVLMAYPIFRGSDSGKSLYREISRLLGNLSTNHLKALTSKN